MIFKLYNCDCGVKIAGISYDFDHVEGVQIEDPEVTKLRRGNNGISKEGIVYKEGINEPKRLSFTVLGMSAELKAVLDSAFLNKTRVEAYCVDRTDGSSKIAKNSVLSNQPMQLAVDGSPESMNVILSFESFDIQENHKS